MQITNNNQPTFKSRLPKGVKPKMFIYDLDDTLLLGPQMTRDKVFHHSKKNGIVVYSTGRPLEKTEHLMRNGTLGMPDYYSGENGAELFKNENGKFKRVQKWDKVVKQGWNKNKVREILINIAQNNMFDKTTWAKVPKELIPQDKKPFIGSKITEYEVFASPRSISFAMAPEVFSKVSKDIKDGIKRFGLNAKINFSNLSEEKITLEELQKHFPKDRATKIRHHVLPRLGDDGSIDTILITPNIDKGSTAEFIRQDLKIRPEEVFAVGDGNNDKGLTNKNYYFGLLANASQGLRASINRLTDKSRILPTPKSGVEGACDILI